MFFRSSVNPERSESVLQEMILLLRSVTVLLCRLMRREAGEELPEAPSVVGVQSTGLQEEEGTASV